MNEQPGPDQNFVVREAERIVLAAQQEMCGGKARVDYMYVDQNSPEGRLLQRLSGHDSDQ